MDKFDIVCSTSRKTLWLLMLCMVIGIIPLAKASAYTIVDLFFNIIKQINYDVWVYAFHGGFPQYITVFAFLKSLVEAIIASATLLSLFPIFGFSTQRILRFGTFQWSFLPIILIVPLMPAGIYIILAGIFHLDLSMGSVPPWGALWMLIVINCLAIPVTEELAFRGLLLSCGQTLGFSNTAVLTATSLAFSLMHISGETGIFSFFVTLPAAFCAGWLRLKSGAIFWSILLHALINFLPLQAMLFFWYSGNLHGFDLSLQALGFGTP